MFNLIKENHKVDNASSNESWGHRTGFWYNNNKKSLGELFRSSTLTRDYKNTLELKLIPEKSGGICRKQ